MHLTVGNPKILWTYYFPVTCQNLQEVTVFFVFSVGVPQIKRKVKKMCQQYMVPLPFFTFLFVLSFLVTGFTPVTSSPRVWSWHCTYVTRWVMHEHFLFIVRLNVAFPHLQLERVMDCKPFIFIDRWINYVPQWHAKALHCTLQEV